MILDSGFWVLDCRFGHRGLVSSSTSPGQGEGRVRVEAAEREPAHPSESVSIVGRSYPHPTLSLEGRGNNGKTLARLGCCRCSQNPKPKIQNHLWLGWVATLAMSIFLAAVQEASAFIDPKFTPLDLTAQAETIALVTTGADRTADSWPLACAEAIKGKALDAGTLKLAPAKPAELSEIRRVVEQNGRAPALLFAAAKDGKLSAYLSVSGVWLAAESTDGKAWTVTGLANRPSGTWAGGTDQLARCVRWCLAEPRADVPVGVGAAWMETIATIAKIDGKISGLAAIDLPGQKDRFLFVASPAGDKLFRAKTGAEEFADVTAAVKLASRSTRFAFGDFTGNGRPDLASWDGGVLRVFEGRADGTFAAIAATFEIKDCLGLSAVRVAKAAPVSLLVSTRGNPLILTLKDNAWLKSELEGLATEDREPAFVSPCIVADFTGDGLPDVLQPRATYGILWKGKPGGFERAAPVLGLQVPEAAAVAAVADFNHDGALDVFFAGAEAVRLYENDGKGHFADVTASSGSFSYKYHPGAGAGASACLAVDINHDGRTDLAVFHAAGGFDYHFNRGFRCFGEEGELRLPPAQPGKGDVGQVAAAAADFNGDGSLDLAVAFTDGRVACFYSEAFSKPILHVSLKAGMPGPVAVSVWQGEKSPLAFCTLSVGPNPARVDFTLHSLEPRECTLKWRRADGAERSMVVKIPEPLPDGGIPVEIGE